MDKADLERFEVNREWFNSFYDGCKKIFDEVAKRLAPPVGTKNPSYYYPKYLAVPTIPQYLSMGCDHRDTYVEIYAVLDSAIFDGSAHFRPEPSMALVRHTDGGKGLWVEQNGIKVLSGQILKEVFDAEGLVLSGLIDNPKETPFQAFQVFFDGFAKAENLSQTVERQILDRLRNLPDLS